MKKSQARILVFAPLGFGGVSSLMIEIQKGLNREIVNFDYLVIHNEKEPLEDFVLNMGSSKLIASADEYSNKIIRNIVRFYRISRICKKNNIKVFHYNGGSPYGLFTIIAAKLGGVKYVTFHSHNGGVSKCGFFMKLCNGLCKKIMPLFVDDFWACSSIAANFSFPKKITKSYRFFPNAIDLNRYLFDNNQRVMFRKELNMENNFIVGNVGRFSKQKNHIFLLDIFYSIYKKDNSARLILCGSGELENQIKDKINSLGLKNVVKIFQNYDKMEKMYQAWDVFIMPSLYEGLPVSGVEAQASNLPILLSNTITHQVCLTNYVKYLDLNEDADVWANAALSFRNSNRKSQVDVLRKKGFDKGDMIQFFQKYYLDIWEKIT